MENTKHNSLATVLVIVGVTGDLSRRKLLPALIKLIEAKVLPEKFRILGTTRKATQKEALLNNLPYSEEIRDKIEILKVDLNQELDLEVLKNKLREIEEGYQEETQIIFNLSVPPKATILLIEALAKAKFNEQPNIKLLLEKPFGYDLESAKELITEINKYFKSEQIYRIDHYLAKEMSQNILVFRDKNYLFKKTWNNNFIKKIEILAEETIGIEGRANFFEQTGTLRDLVQSHLLQLTALTLLALDKDSDIRTLRAKALSQIEIAKDEKGNYLATRGQYLGYQEEVNNPNSYVETFVKLELVSRDPQWQNVPIILRTGKNLKEKKTEIKIYYHGENATLANVLTLKIQPNEGIDFSINSKAPGYTKKITKQTLSMPYYQESKTYDAYEQVLLDTIYSDPDLFISDTEVLESWRIIDPVQKLWQKAGEGLIKYEPKSNVEDILK